MLVDLQDGAIRHLLDVANQVVSALGLHGAGARRWGCPYGLGTAHRVELRSTCPSKRDGAILKCHLVGVDAPSSAFAPGATVDAIALDVGGALCARQKSA